MSSTEHQGLSQLLLVFGFAFATLNKCIALHLPTQINLVSFLQILEHVGVSGCVYLTQTLLLQFN